MIGGDNLYLYLGEDVVLGRQIICFYLRDVAYCLDLVRSFYMDVLHFRDCEDFENYFAWIVDGEELGIAEYWQSVVSPKTIFHKIAARDFMNDIFSIYEIFKLGWLTQAEYSLNLEKIFFKHFGQAWEKNITLRNRKGLQARRA